MKHLRFFKTLVKLTSVTQTLFACILLGFALPVNSVQAQEQGLRWGKWSGGYSESISFLDEVVDSYIDSVGNTYIFGRCGGLARLGENGPYICPMDSCADEMGYWMVENMGVFLTKIDSLGNILWCKSARNGTIYSGCGPLRDFAVKDGKITIAFDNVFGSDRRNWLYFFDTMLIEPSYQYHTNEHRTYFATFDMDGNLLEFHDIQLFVPEINPQVVENCHFADRGSSFVIDEDNNIHIFAHGAFYSADSLHKAYIIVDGDTNRKYPLNIKTQNGNTFATSMYFKMDSDWNLISSRFMIDSITVWNPSGGAVAYLEFKETTILGDEIYASCIFHHENYSFNPDTLPIRVYLDSVHYLRIDNMHDWADMPCLLKLNLDGEVVWVQQLYNEQPEGRPGNYMPYGGLATDAENVYVSYKPSWVSSTRFYIDSAHSIQLPLVANFEVTGYCLVVSYNRNTGSFVDYYIADTANSNCSQNSLEVIGDWLLLNLYYYRLDKTELCKINKYTKEVTRLSKIQYNYNVQCKNLSVNDYGWVFRGETGAYPLVYDSILVGNEYESSIMMLFYDSTLDLHRHGSCLPVDSLWCDVTAGHTVTLSWHSQPGRSGYELAYIPESGSWEDATVIETEDTTLTVTLPGDQCYLFRVRGLCDGNCVDHSPWSDTITVCPQVGIGEVEGNCAISLHPNPASGTVQIEGLRGQMATVEVLDMTGRQVMSLYCTSSFNAANLPTGIYIVRVKTLHDNAETITHLNLVKK